MPSPSSFAFSGSNGKSQLRNQSIWGGIKSDPSGALAVSLLVDPSSD